jgi:hypothetical protein
MEDLPKERAMRFLFLLVVALAPNSALIAGDVPNVPDEARAIRDIVRLGGNVGRRVDGHVMSVQFRHGNDFGDENTRLLAPFTKLEMLNLQGTQIAGTRISGSGLNELNASPVTVLTSWCRLTTLTPVISWTSACRRASPFRSDGCVLA